MSLNMIGLFRVRNFVSDPPPGRIQQDVEVINVRGVDYSILRHRGLRSDGFACETVTDCASLIDARLAYLNYTTSTGANPAKLIWNGYDYDIEKQRFAITKVELLSIRRNIFICGALNPGYTWDLRVRWMGILTPLD